MTREVILVGHGAPALDCPRPWVLELRKLEAGRQATGGSPTEQERSLDRLVRDFPRTAANDPYRVGIEALADAVRPRLGGLRLTVAYNEFCAPSLEDAVAARVHAGARDFVIVSSMMTPGGSHSEIDVPHAIERIRALHPGVRFHYAWPYDLGGVAAVVAERVGTAP